MSGRRPAPGRGARRPWPRAALVAVTAVLAAAVGYGAAASKGEPAETEPWLLGDWVAAGGDEHGAPFGGLLEAATAATPDAVPAGSVVLGHGLSDYSDEIIVLPAGEYRVYASCRTVDPPGTFTDLGYDLGIRVPGRPLTVHATLSCPDDAARVRETVTVDGSTVLAVESAPAMSSDIRDPKEQNLLEYVVYAVAVFFVPV